MNGVKRILETLPEKYWTVVTSATDRRRSDENPWTVKRQAGVRNPAIRVTGECVQHTECLGLPGQCHEGKQAPDRENRVCA